MGMNNRLFGKTASGLTGLVALLLMVPLSAQASDWMRNSGKFSMSVSTDHLYFEILLADLDYSNTYAKAGSVYAEPADGKGGPTLQLMELYTYDMSSSTDKDEYAMWDVKARLTLKSAKAWFANVFGKGEEEIANASSVSTYSLQKFGKDNHYLAAKVDYYFPAVMAGRKWKFYYKYTHNEDGAVTMQLGTHTLSQDVGCKGFDAGDFSYERKGMDKFRFSVPALPDDVVQKVREVRRHVGKYYLTSVYTLQGGGTFQQRDTLKCEATGRKDFDIDIPIQAGNFKRADLKVEVEDALEDESGSFWNNRHTYNRINVFQTVPIPHGLGAEFDMFDNKTELAWNAFETGDNNYVKETVPYVYRRKTQHDGTPISGAAWEKRTSLKEVGDVQSQSYTDRSAEANAYYQFMVLNVPKAWTSNNSITSSDLDNPSDDLLQRLAYTLSDVVATSPMVNIFDFEQDITVTDKVRITWKYSKVPVSAKQVTFNILRRQSGETQWKDFGTVTAPSEPSASDVASFSDADLPNSHVRYEYKVRLAINDNANIFESAVLKAGLLSGTTVTSLDATKGTHENTVRVTWRSKQVGTTATSYELFRRYAESNDEYMQIYSTTGTSDSYTYEDNTVKPGYFYEYKVEAYSGDKTTYADNTFQNSLVATGFCQTRGVISGNITFGTNGTTAVEDVRVSLRSNADTDGSVVRGYSKRFDGVTTGVVWETTQTESDKVFGNDRNYAVQFFIRPDDTMQEGAVLAEIPGRGHLVLGAFHDGAHELRFEEVHKDVEKYTVNKINRFRGIAYWNDNTTPTQVVNGLTVYSLSEATAKHNQLIDDGYTSQYTVALGGKAVMWPSGSDNVFNYYYKTEDIEPVTVGKETTQTSYYSIPLTIPASQFSLVTIQKSGSDLTFTVNGKTETMTKTNEDGPVTKEFGTDYNIKDYDGKRFLLDFGDGPEAFFQDYPQAVSTHVAGEAVADAANGSGKVWAPFAVGGSKGSEASMGFKGNITEVRVFDHQLTDKEALNYADRYLNGRESGLKLYWPMDEGLDRYVFDASYANDQPNGRHAVVGTNVKSSTIVPTELQLSRYAITNANGEYAIRGIPYIGSGTTYTVTPTKGIHVFNPQSRSGFIGTGSLVLNSYDFSDESSFPMRGKITYLNTNIPSDSIQFKIDGTLLQTKNGMVCSDANGEYEISVPIGKHLIECYKEGHRLTSFPKDGNTFDFKEDLIVNFVDSTLVNVTGRINGGYSDQDEPLSFNRSQNRLGRAIVKLSLGKEAQCSFNYVVDEHGDGKFGTENIPVLSAHENIKSTGYRAGGKQDDTRFVYITTDEKNGEFSALLPPLKYKVESITFAGGKDYDEQPVFKDNLPVIDATNTIKERLLKDSIEIDKTYYYYYYSGKLVRQYRAEPTITVTQEGMKNGAFGEVEVPVTSKVETTEMATALKYTEKGYEYVFGHPLFRQQERYKFDIYVKEQYKNLDTGETLDEVPQDAVVNIANDACQSTIVYAKTQMVGGQEVKPGMEYQVTNLQANPDAKGHVGYEWMGGWPNLGTGFLRNLSISVTTNGRTTMWHAPNSTGDALDLILLGSICTGTNFVTRGPDDIHMILRRPPGATSVAQLTNDTIRTTSYKKDYTTSSSSVGGGFYLSLAPTFNVAEGTAVLMVQTKWGAVANTTNIWNKKESDWTLKKDDDTYTLSETVKTPTNMLSVQNNGDTYIGRATNMQFGDGRIVGIFKQSDGSYKLEEQNAITIGESFGTDFAYSQRHIEKTLIPNWEKNIDDKLTHIDADHWVKGNCPKVPGKVMYYTKYKKGDPEWGRTNADSRWTDYQKAVSDGHPSYLMVNGTDDPDAEDEVNFYNNQITRWKEVMGDNEADKLNAIEASDNQYMIDNFSIAGGTSLTRTTSLKTSRMSGVKHDYAWSFNNEDKLGFFINNFGAHGILKIGLYENDNWQRDTTNVVNQAVTWTMSDGDAYCALSVDVYESPKGWGPIFRTRGGQTRNPYEPATYTKYYRQGTQLDEATMRVEKPQLKVNGATELTDVPTGGQAKFELELQNLSETNTPNTYILEAPYIGNAKGAVLMIDGAPLSVGRSGRSVRMEGGAIMKKTLLVSQSDRSVTDFKDIKLILRSDLDITTCSDTVRLNIHFVPASATVDMKVDHTVLNKEDFYQYKGVQVTFSNLDRQDKGLKGVRLQYRRKGTDSWTLAHQWRLKEYMQTGDEELPTEGSTLTCTVSFLDDGIYELRGQTFGTYGTADVTYETEIIEMLQDTRGPKILGMPSPEGNLLTYSNHNEMHIRFNEDLNVNALSKSDNFRIEGDLNNTSVKSQYTDVAAQLNGNEFSTDATYSLLNSDFALGLWIYRNSGSDGNIISLGTADNKLSLFTHDGGKLAVRIGDESKTYDAGKVLPENIWTYVALSYKRKNDTDPENRITMLYANADTGRDPVFVGDNVPAGNLDGRGKLTIGGNGMKGMMHTLSLWNIDKSATELYETRNEHFAAFTPGLVGFWEMKEGHGTTLIDDARSRHITMPNESWYINNRNLAAHLDGKEPVKVSIGSFNARMTDSYALEMWFRGDDVTSNKNAQLLSVLNGISIGFKDGKLTLETSERSINDSGLEQKNIQESVVLSEKNYNDKDWHHLALNVRRGTSAIAYIDGEAVKTLPESSLPPMAAAYMVVGGEQTMLDAEGKLTEEGGVTRLFTGDIDEVRLWNAALDGQLIKERRYTRLDDSYVGLVGYFPMESISRNDQGTVTTQFKTDNFGVKNSPLKLFGTPLESENAPALLPGASRMRLDDRQFDFTASKNEIYFSFGDEMLPLMDGNEFTVTVSNIKDEHGNPSEPIEWTFNTDFATLTWLGEQEVEKGWDETKTFTASLYNLTGFNSQSYEISGLPSWMTVNSTIGTVDQAITEFTFTILPTVSVGQHTAYIYVSDSRGIKRVLPVHVTVKGDEPEWSVNPNLYESNMTVTGQIYVGDKISEYVRSKIAAFDDNGLCRGVASPKYVSTRDAYYVDMIIYGASATDLSSGQRDLTFQMYDASTGITYPVVIVTQPDGTKGTTLRYAPDSNLGSYDHPVAFSSTDDQAQSVSLPRGWTWMSLCVQPASTAIADVLPKGATELEKYRNIKGKAAFATTTKKGTVIGELKEMAPSNMYKIQTSTATTLNVYGKTIDVSKTEATIYPGYNWIGTLSNSVMSVDDAFADLNPQKDDMVKTRTAMSTYNGKGVWEGTLANIMPGEGYIYLSRDTKAKTFNYPRVQPSASQSLSPHYMSSATRHSAPTHYKPVDEHLYPDNMNIIAVIEKDGERREDAEIGAFVNGECRGAVTCNSGYYFLTILGSAADDMGNKVELRVMLDEVEYVVAQLDFISDAFYGTLDEPKTYDVNVTGINSILIDDEDDNEWYTTQGYKLAKRPTTPGVYVHRGQKVVVQAKKQ